jgi:hypothetical protein
MQLILLTGKLKEKVTYRVLCIYSSFVHGGREEWAEANTGGAASPVEAGGCRSKAALLSLPGSTPRPQVLCSGSIYREIEIGLMHLG